MPVDAIEQARKLHAMILKEIGEVDVEESNRIYRLTLEICKVTTRDGRNLKAHVLGSGAIVPD